MAGRTSPGSGTGLLVLATALLIAAGALLGSSGHARALVNCTVADSSVDSEEAAFLGLLNDYRSANGLGLLTLSTNLNRGATWIVDDMAAKHYFAHVDSFGRTPYQRGLDCGYPQGAGENLAGGGDWGTAREVFDAWKASPAHNQNMLGSFYTQAGIARLHDPNSDYGWYWATTFGAGNDAPLEPQPTAKPAPETAAVSSSPGVTVHRGANLLLWTGPAASPAVALTPAGDDTVVYAFDSASGSWLRYGAAIPPTLNTLALLQPGQAYWVLVDAELTLDRWR